MPNTAHYKPQSGVKLFFNQWDVIILILFLGLICTIVFVAKQMASPYELGQPIAISLDPSMLPSYAMHTIVRMGIALLLSLLFTFTIGTLAAKSHKAERFILPFIDIMQSVPILGFLSLGIFIFIFLFPGSRLGPECAAIFAIFTSQVWNMALSFYQSLRTVPKELKEAAKLFHLTPWQQFWRLEVPFATPSLIWNTMMSLSAGWFFVVASEAIAVNNQTIFLPGMGSYIYMAINQSDYQAITYVIFSMFIVILIYDQLVFRPLIAWSEKFKIDDVSNLDDHTETWFLNLLQRAQLVRTLILLLKTFRNVLTLPWFPTKIKSPTPLPHLPPPVLRFIKWFWSICIFLALGLSFFLLGHFIYAEVTNAEILEVFYLGLITGFKVLVLILVSSLIWVPLGVWIGLTPKVANIMQPLTQFLAAFPANLVYPVLFMFIVHHHLNVNIWSAPLMILGTQWYILFNVIAGTRQLPEDLHLVAKNYGLKKGLWWKKFILPGIFPYYITGAMTAAGGCWNASIVAEVISWGNETIFATGLGSYIAHYTALGNFPRIGLGIAVMSLYVIIINRLVWHKLYLFAEKRFQLG